MEELARFITDERTGLKYELCGDYYIIAGEDEPERKPIGVWGQRHLNYLRDNKRVLLYSLQLSGKLNGYIADIDQQAEDMFFRLVKQMAECESVSETLKAEDQMEWIQRINSIRNRAIEIVNTGIIFV